MSQIIKMGLKENRRKWYLKNKIDQLAKSKKRFESLSREDLDRRNKLLNRSKPLIYIAYDKFFDIIYVGRTNEFIKRMTQHKRQNSVWLNEMAYIEQIYYPTYGDSLLAEATMIQKYQPRYNTYGVTR